MQNEETEAKIKELESKIEELENNWKRALADYRNLQKRTEEEKESLVDFISSMLFKRLIPILDNLELMEKHNAEDQGIKMITGEFRQLLKDEGVMEIEAEGKKFDSNCMDAIDTVANGEGQDQTADSSEFEVIEVLNKGYMFKNKLVRPARVKVGPKKKEE